MGRAVLRTVTALAMALQITAALGAGDVRAARPDEIRTVVTLGDSYSSGTGIHRNASDYDDHGPPAQSFDDATRIGHSDCQRELDETPGPRLAEMLGAESVFVACAGAVAADLANQVAAAGLVGDGSGAFVTVTIGGNDVRTGRGESWPQALVRCITSARCDRSDRNRLANLDEVRAELSAAYRALGEQYPHARVRVLGYPRLMQSDRWCEGVTGVSEAEADWIDDQVDRLNYQIGTAVASARVQTGADLEFLPVVDAFDNRGACRFWQRDRYINDSVMGDTLTRSMTSDGQVRDHWHDGVFNISAAAFHPSSKGYDAFLDVLAADISADLALTDRS